MVNGINNDKRKGKDMGYAVLHIEKGNAGSAAGLGTHIDRTKRVLNADPARTPENFYVRCDLQERKLTISHERKSESLQQRIDDRIKEGYTGKTAIRRDAVTHLNIILSGSHPDMERIAANRKDLYNWAFNNMKFIGQNYGYENIVEFSVHMDERTPHIHCVVIPLTKDGRLSAKKVMGDREKMSALQDRYGKEMSKLHNLSRGVKGSTATHDSVREYYARINECIRSSACESLKIPEVFITPPQIGVPPLIGRESWAEKQNKAIYEAFSSGTDEILHKIAKRDTAKIREENNGYMKLTEECQRLKKQNAQLHGVIKEQDKILNPQKYVKHSNKQNIPVR
jgi:hypothetical protein